MDAYSFQILLLAFVNIFNLVSVYIVVVMPVFIYDVSFLIFYILTMSGDVESNPGPGPTKHRQCRILYANIRGLHGNLNDLIASSRQYDILLCSETLVSGMRHVSEVLIPGFKKPVLLQRNAIPRAQGMAVYLKVRLHEDSLLAPVNYPRAKAKLVNCPGEFTVQDSGK